MSEKFYVTSSVFGTVLKWEVVSPVNARWCWCKDYPEAIKIADALNTARERDALRCELDAWHSVFGTTQLSHAQARLEAAERQGVLDKARMDNMKERIRQLETPKVKVPTEPGWYLFRVAGKDGRKHIYWMPCFDERILKEVAIEWLGPIKFSG